MDSKKTLTLRFPLFGIIFMLIASAAFYYCRTQDSAMWFEIDNYYSHFLLKQEKPLYLDFYQKRLSIEQQGSAEHLETIKSAIDEKNNAELTKLVLSDRGFRDFLKQKVPIYFSEKQKEYWQTHNLVISAYLNQLPTYRFAIIPEIFTTAPEITVLFTHIYIEKDLINFISNIVILFLLFWLAESYLNRALVIGVTFSTILLNALIYLVIANSLSPPLQGLNTLLYVVVACLISFIMHQYYFISVKKPVYYCLIAVFIICSKIALDVYQGIFHKEILIALLLLSPIAFISAWFCPDFFKQTNTKAIRAIKDPMSPSLRKDYTEALSALSRFNFKYARQQLRSLSEKYPESDLVTESSYHLEKLVSDEAFFWSLAQKRVDKSLIRENYPDMLSTFQDIQKAAPSRNLAGKNLTPDHYLKMLVVFLKQGDIEKAEHAFMFLELSGDRTLVNEACKLLIEIFSKRHNLKKQQHYQALYDSYLTNS